jgi:outer membrane protein assembly factor BamB
MLLLVPLSSSGVAGSLINTLGPFLIEGGGPLLLSPEGFIFHEDQMLLVDQQINQDNAGFVDVLDKTETSWKFNRVIPSGAADAVFAPRELVVKNDLVYVADITNAQTTSGQLLAYNITTGLKKYAVDVPLLEKAMQPQVQGETFFFNPTGLVFGPDNKLYVTARSLVNPDVGYIFRFNRDLTRDQQFLISSTNISNLRRPDSPRWSNDFSALVVTSFNEPKANPPAFDQLIVIPGAEKGFTRSYSLPLVTANPGQRNLAQKIVFGPDDYLYVGITTRFDSNVSKALIDNAAAVYKFKFILDKTDIIYEVVVRAGTLTSPFNLGFLRTDPATLRYN